MKRITTAIALLLFMLPFSYALPTADTARPPIVILSFDDAEISHYTVVAPMLKKYHCNATFFVCDFPRKTPADSVEFMNWQQIQQLHQMGFEIGNHTGHHKNVTKLSREQLQKEIQYIDDKCNAWGIPKPISFAYPGNRADSQAQVVLHQMGYRYARAGNSQYFNPATHSLLQLPSYTMGSTEKLLTRTRKALEELQPGQILIFTIHGVPDTLHPDYTTTPEQLESFLQLIQQRHYKVIAMRELAEYLPETSGL